MHRYPPYNQWNSEDDNTVYLLEENIGDCCQWAEEVEKSQTVVTAEIRRMGILSKECETIGIRYQLAFDKRSALLNELTKETVNATVEGSTTYNFLKKIGVVWQEAQDCIRDEFSEEHFKSAYASPIGGPLYEYADYTQTILQRRLATMRNTSEWHQKCATVFSVIHEQISPKLDELLRCDVILQNKIFCREAAPFLENQLTELHSFSANNAFDTIASYWPPIPQSSLSYSFSTIEEFLFDGLLENDSVIIPPAGGPYIPSYDGQPEPQQPQKLQPIKQAEQAKQAEQHQNTYSPPSSPEISFDFLLSSAVKSMRGGRKQSGRGRKQKLPSFNEIDGKTATPTCLESPKPPGRLRPIVPKAQAKFRPISRGHPYSPGPVHRIVGLPNGRQCRGHAPAPRSSGFPQGYSAVYATGTSHMRVITAPRGLYPAQGMRFMGQHVERPPLVSFAPTLQYPEGGLRSAMPRNCLAAPLPRYEFQSNQPAIIRLPGGHFAFPPLHLNDNVGAGGWIPLQTHRIIECPSTSQTAFSSQRYADSVLDGKENTPSEDALTQRSLLRRAPKQRPGDRLLGQFAFRVQDNQLIEVPEARCMHTHHQNRVEFCIKNNRIVEVASDSERLNDDCRVVTQAKTKKIFGVPGEGGFTPGVSQDGTIAFNLKSNRLLEVSEGSSLVRAFEYVSDSRLADADASQQQDPMQVVGPTEEDVEIIEPNPPN